MQEPLIAITMGDPAGVGPETIAKAWRHARWPAGCRPLVVGLPEILERACRLVDAGLEVVEVAAPEEAAFSPHRLPCLAAGSREALSVRPGQVDPLGGRAACDAVVLATELALAGRVDAISTGPLNKEALAAAGVLFPGHTELLADLCGIKDVAMMLYLPPDEGRQTGASGLSLGAAGLGVTHVTLHLALRKVFSHLSVDAIVSKAMLTHHLLRALLPDESAGPRIGVCALNPHAGESGLFGDEEQTIIEPAVRQAAQQGMQISGPLPADTLMRAAADGQFDGVVAMYHDQGHIGLKLLDMYHAVNVTLGLPIIRTSVAHGTAFDLAWQGRADCRGLVSAVSLAAQLANRRRSRELFPDSSTISQR